MKRNLIGGTKISNVSKKPVEQKKLIQEIFEETKFVSFNKDKDLTVGEGDEELSYEPLKYPERREVELGQLKLLVSEIEFLTYYWNPEIVPNPTIVYVGAAPGIHTSFLSALFPEFEFHLYDNGRWSPLLSENPRIHLHSKYFTAEEAEKWKNRSDIFFISDIRSLDYDENADKEDINEQKKSNSLLLSDLAFQKEWVEIIKPVQSLLKFRLPFSRYIWIKEKTFPYLDGTLYLQPWARHNATEVRLVPSGEMRNWNLKRFEDMMFYHNKIRRQKINYQNPITETNTPVNKSLGMTNDYDSVATAVILSDYLVKRGINVEEATMNELLSMVLYNANNGNKLLKDQRREQIGPY